MAGANKITTHIDAVLALARPDILSLRAYSHAEWNPALERLHANESPMRNPADTSTQGLNRYPEPQPRALVERLALLYDVLPERLLVGRGSDEAIDLIVRAFCRAAVDAVLICPPTFGMYAVAARIQGADVIEVPLLAGHGFALDVDAVLRAVTPSVKIVFLCTPNNPTGTVLAQRDIERLVAALAGRAIAVVDEAYIEFSQQASLVKALADNPHLVILRTLSKFHGLAGARVGSLLAHSQLIELLRKIIPPYAIAQSTVEVTLNALTPESLRMAHERGALIVSERETLRAALSGAAGVLRVWPSEANFLLVEFADPQRVLAAIADAGLLVRDARGYAGLSHALRLTIGTHEQNRRLLAAITEAVEAPRNNLTTSTRAHG